MKNIFRLIILIILSGFGCAGSPNQASQGEKPPLEIANLRDIPQDALEELSKKFDGSEVYIVVHPSYYIFFHEKGRDILPDEQKSLVETFVETEYGDTGVLYLMKEYQKAEMQLISSAKDKKRLVVLLIPGHYTTSSHYIFKDGQDGYAQYINGLTRDTDSVFYIESKSVNSGKMLEDDQKALLNFLSKIRAQKVYIGGGYIGRCQKDFYNFLSKAWSENNIAIIPEISAFSPEDLSDSTARMLLTSNMKLNSSVVNSFITNGRVKRLETIRPNVKNIPISEIQ